MSLRIKLTISYFLLSLFTIVSLYLITNYAIKKHFHNYVMDQREETNLEILGEITTEFNREQFSPNKLRAISERARQRNVFMQIDDMYGREIFRSGPRMAQPNMGMGGHRHNSKQYALLERQELPPDQIVRKSYPILMDGTQVATLHLTCPLEFNNADNYFMDMLATILGQIALLCLLVAILLGLYMAYRISHPLKKVIEQTREIEKGNFSARINSYSNTTELDDLISSVNTLARTLDLQMQSKKRMARDYAHEIRTPLAAIQSNLEGMIDGVLDTTPIRLESCRAEILRISRMISEVDKLVEIESSNYKLHKQQTDLHELLQKTIMSFEKPLLDKEITLSSSIPNVSILADTDKLSQVFVNIISNAVKYTPSGGHLDVSILEHDQQVEIVISDTGIGIPAKDLPYIFDHLYRADLSRARDTGGSGIGLSIAKAIIEAHAGSITATSEQGQGSKFIIYLPK